MADHVLNEVLDYFQDRVTTERRRAIESHLESCPACAKGYQFGSSLREDGLHLNATRLVEIADEHGGGLTTFEKNHLHSCEDCRSELDRLKALPQFESIDDIPREWTGGDADKTSTTDRHTRPVRDARPKLRRRTFGVLGGLGIAATAVLMLFGPQRNDQTGIIGLAQIEPIPIRTQRATPDAGPLEEMMAEGIAAYQAADYQLAAESFRQITLDAPERADAWILLGSIELLTNADGLGVPELRTGAERATSTAEEAQARWILAQAHLALNQPEPALEELKKVEELGSRYADRARALSESVNGSLRY